MQPDRTNESTHNNNTWLAGAVKRSGALFSAIMSTGRICPCLQERDETGGGEEGGDGGLPDSGLAAAGSPADQSTRLEKKRLANPARHSGNDRAISLLAGSVFST